MSFVVRVSIEGDAERSPRSYLLKAMAGGLMVLSKEDADDVATALADRNKSVRPPRTYSVEDFDASH